MEKSTDSRRPQIDNALLRKLALFAELDGEELKALVDQSGTASFAANQKIISTGDAGHCMYVILSGKARVSSTIKEESVELDVLGPGDFFGEVALVDDGPRSADVTALEDCQLLCITRMTLGVLAGLQPGAAIHLLAAIGRCLVERLRAGNQKYIDLIALGRQSA